MQSLAGGNPKTGIVRLDQSTDLGLRFHRSARRLWCRPHCALHATRSIAHPGLAPGLQARVRAVPAALVIRMVEPDRNVAPNAAHGSAARARHRAETCSARGRGGRLSFSTAQSRLALPACRRRDRASRCCGRGDWCGLYGGWRRRGCSRWSASCRYRIPEPAQYTRAFGLMYCDVVGERVVVHRAVIDLRLAVLVRSTPARVLHPVRRRRARGKSSRAWAPRLSVRFAAESSSSPTACAIEIVELKRLRSGPSSRSASGPRP